MFHALSVSQVGGPRGRMGIVGDQKLRMGMEIEKRGWFLGVKGGDEWSEGVG